MSTQTQRKYRVIREQQPQQESQENEIRVRKEGNCRVYINRAAELLLRAENKLDSITISAIGQAIPIALVVSERIREKIAGLFTIQKIQSIPKKFIYEPLEEGLDRQEQTRYNASFKITLTRNVTEAQRADPGFQDVRQNVQALTLDQIINFRPQNRNFNRNYDGPRSNNNNNNNRSYNQGNQGGRNGSFQDRRNGQTQRRGSDRREKRPEGQQRNYNNNNQSRGGDRQDNRQQDTRGGNRGNQ